VVNIQWCSAHPTTVELGPAHPGENALDNQLFAIVIA